MRVGMAAGASGLHHVMKSRARRGREERETEQALDRMTLAGPLELGETLGVREEKVRHVLAVPRALESRTFVREAHAASVPAPRTLRSDIAT